MIAVTERRTQEMKYPKANGTKTRTQNPNRGLAAEPLVFATPESRRSGRAESASASGYRIPSFSPRRSSVRLSASRRARVSSRFAMPTQTS